MALREIIEIDEALCDGCGACATGCHEGALRIVEGKARLVGESLCDGLGACLGECPRGAIRVTRREAEEYDERRVMEGLARHGPAVISAHFEHLSGHGQDIYVRQAREWLAEKGIPDPTAATMAPAAIARSEETKLGVGSAAPHAAATFASRPKAAASAAALESQSKTGACADRPGGCPGSASRRFAPVHEAHAVQATRSLVGARTSALGHWPIQLHLINPRAPQFNGTHLLVAADCTAFSIGNFHEELLSGKSLVIACPKLDQGREVYLDKLASLVESAASVTVAIMEVPCCSGLLKLVLDAREKASGRPKIDCLIIGIEGGIVGTKSY